MSNVGKDVDELKQTVDALTKKNWILKAQLDLAVQQRDGFAANYHAVMRIPFSERNEIIGDCNYDIEKLNDSTDI